MASVREFKGKWQVQIRLKGIPPVVRSFDLEGDARKWGEKEESRLKRERAFGPAIQLQQKQPKCSITLGDLIERYIAEVTANRRTERAVQTQTYELRAFQREPICGKLLTDLTVSDFNSYALERIKTCQKRTVKRQLSVIGNALKTAEKIWNYPANQSWISELGFKAKPVNRERRLAEGEYERLIEACDRIGTNFKGTAKLTPRIMKLVIQIALLTSMRKSELVEMEWCNVRFRESYIHVPKTKTNEKRDIPLLPEAAKLLAAFHPERISDDLVFPFHLDAMDSAWDRLIMRAGIKDLHLHDLRHEALSRLGEAGVVPAELMMFSGHKSLAQLSKYVHGSRRNVLSKFNNEISLLTL